MPPKIQPNRVPHPEQPIEVRIHNHLEVAPGYTAEQVMAEATRCLDCKKPGCVAGCPVHNEIPDWLKPVAAGDFVEAARIIKHQNLLPSITGRVCPHELQCEGHCTMGRKYEAVCIGGIERFIGDYVAAAGELALPDCLPPSGKKVAVVGSGPAGISAATDLAVAGHDVTIFEAMQEAGGVMVYGIPEFRLPKAVVAREIENLSKIGVKLVKNFVVGAAATLDELLEEFDAVFIGTGACVPWFMGIPGENLNGIYTANEYLARINLMKSYQFPTYDTPITPGKRVITVGGGNVAMDSARSALRLGADESMIVYRRSREECPACAEEIHQAEQEGVKFFLLTNPVAFHDRDGDGWVHEVELLRMELGEVDASGRRSPVPVEGSNYRMPADLVILSIGQAPSPLVPKSTQGLDTGRKSNIIIDPETGRTSKRGVFAGGDVVSGGATVVLAVKEGRAAARSIDEYLRTGDW